jgi:cell division protein FtsW
MGHKLKFDRVLFLATLLLLSASVVMVYSASAVLALARYGQPYLFLFKQMTWALLGLLILALTMRIDYRRYRQPVVLTTALVVSLIALVAVLFSPPVKGTRRWFGIGGIGVQPSELAKLTVILVTAARLERCMDRIDEPAAVGSIGALVALVSGLVLLEPDFGTALAIVLVVAVMVYVAGLSYRLLGAAMLVTVPAVLLAVLSADYRRRRLLAFLDPWNDPLGDGFQIIQSLIAVGTGGLFGRGVMEGVQKLFYLPEPHTDFIYAVIAEETGLVGALAILGCFSVIAWRGLRAAVRAPDRFGALVAVGITTMVSLQAFVNMSVVLGLMPTKGLALPLVSAGGSSLLVNLVGLGILLNVSQQGTAARRVGA